MREELIKSKHRSPLVRKLVDDISERISSGALRPGDALPGAHALAAEYGIGYSTVIHAYKTLSDAGLITTIRGSGAFVKSVEEIGVTDLAVCMQHDVYNPHSEWCLRDMLAGMSAAALARGVRMQLLFAEAVGEKWRDVVDSMSGTQGVMLCWEAPPVWVLRLQKKSIPYALVMPTTRGDWETELPLAFPDYYTGVNQAVTALLEKGFRKPAFLGNPEDRHESPRYIGYGDALAKRGIEAIDVIPCPGISRSDGQAAMARYLASHGRPQFDLLVSANDLRALGAMDVFTAQGVRVPEDVAVLGFDNIPAAAEAGLSTVQLNMQELGESSVHWFLDEVAGSDGREIPKLRIECPATWRGSTGR